METEQLNIRLPVDLLHDLDVVSRLLKINKSEWIKTKLAEEVYEEKNRLLMELSTLYANGVISKKKVKQIVGKDIADEMGFIKQKSKEGAIKGIKYGKRLKKRGIHI